jgi:structural maintenance of chromosome 1
MDAISFVLGIKSAQLRSSQLKDLVYRGRRLAANGVDGDGSTAQDDFNGEGEGEGTAKKASVLAIYEDEKQQEWRFQRTFVHALFLLCALPIPGLT